MAALAQEEIPVTLRAHTLRYDRAARLLVASGDVVVIYQDVTISADHLRANLETHDVRAEGNVVIEVGRYRARGAALDYNLTSRQGRIEQAAADYTGPPVLGTVRIRAAVIEGTLGGATVGREGFCTTCEGPTRRPTSPRASSASIPTTASSAGVSRCGSAWWTLCEATPR
jgi:lipopolysaccharide assembly outer membrane protein LptD (OstA)